MTDDVSRETPPTPESARGAFSPERLPLAERYVAWLAGAGVVRGLIGPRETERLWDRHVLNSLALAEAVPADRRVADLGSGAGLPGLVLAIARPDLHVTLVEPLLRRTTFLEEVVEDLGLSEQVEVLRGRAESLHGERSFDIVTSRALAPLDRLLGWSMPLVTEGGAMVALKGARAAQEAAEVVALCRDAGASEPELVEVGSGVWATTLVRVTWAGPARVSWPTAPERSPGRPRAGSRGRKRRRRPGQ